MGFIQIIESRTSRIDELNAMLDAWLEKTAGKRLATRGTQTRDRDAENTYVQIVEFPSYEDSMTNRSCPRPASLRQRSPSSAMGRQRFRNLEVLRVQEM